MAKRRNLKKEKALRNQAYARKFRKRSNTGRFGRRRSFNNNPSNQESDDMEESESNDGGQGSSR
jgi:hypothetical protein